MKIESNLRIIAEAMKVLGYVNRFNRGIARVKRELADNRNRKGIGPDKGGK